MPEQLICARAIHAGGDADGDGGGDQSRGELERLAESGDDSAGGRFHGGDALRVADEYCELVAAEARRGVRLADKGGEAAGGGHEQLIADAVSLRVVDDLEVVKVDEQHARDPAGPLGRGDLLRYPVLEQQPVRQPGQGVVEGPVLQLLLELVLPGHVPEGEDKAGHVGVGAQVTAPGLDVHDAAVEPGDPLLLDARA